MLKLTALLTAFILILAGCTSDSAPDQTSGPLVVIGESPTPTRTSTSPTTTTRELIDPTKCSSADLHGEVENYAEAYDGLPGPVAATREAIIEAALSCDFEALTALAVPLIEQGPGGESAPLIFSGVTRDIDKFVAYDQQHSALRKLAMALSSVPAELVESEDRDRVPVIFYTWPPLDPRLWDDDTIERVAALNGISAVDGSGDYALVSVAILKDGRWMAAYVEPGG